MNLQDINPSSVRKYLYEYVLMALVGCVVYLFLSQKSLNEFIRTDGLQQRLELQRTVEQNSNTINSFLDYQKRLEARNAIAK